MRKSIKAADAKMGPQNEDLTEVRKEEPIYQEELKD